MNKTQLALSIEQRRLVLVEIEKDLNRYILRAQEEITFDFDFYSEVLEQGNSKAMADTTYKVLRLLPKFATKKLALCFNMGYAKSLLTHLERGLAPAEQQSEWNAHAASFISNHAEYLTQPIRLQNSDAEPYEKYFLQFLPKRHLTRLKMMILPARKDINLIDFSHFALQSLYDRQFDRRALLEIEENYLTFSVINLSLIESMVHLPLEAGSDAAYFALAQLKTASDLKLFNAAGEGATDSTLAFITGASGVKLMPAKLPTNTVLKTAGGAPVLVAFGCALKALEYFQ